MTTATSQVLTSDWDLYAVPGSGQAIGRVENVLRCQQTGQEYPLSNGIPHFLRFEAVESSQVAEQLAQLNRRAGQIGWKPALAEVYGVDSNLYQYVTDEVRAAYLNLLPLTADSVVLEVGPGLGQFTALLAAKARCVYALEVVSGQAMFVAQRTGQSGVSNVAVACGGDDCWLPYKAKSFDVVVLNLVFEWCSARSSVEAPSAAQQRLLGEVARVLKPGGMVYLATKNRYSLQYLTGGRDEHMYGLRFGSALPRWLAQACLWLRGRGRPPGLLHSQADLRRMLAVAGLVETCSYWAAPEMRYPTQFVATDAPSIRLARRQGLVEGFSRRTRWLMPLVPAALVKYVTPGLAFTARRPVAGRPRACLAA